jgi:AbrB family looped-hinge helix DNA binding protein
LQQVKVTRKYQITIPKSTRSKLGINVGDKLLVKEERGKIVIEVPERVQDPSDFLWSLSESPTEIDAVKLVEDSWKED